MKSNALESRPQAYKRITDGIRNFLNHSIGARQLIQEAKQLEIWKDKWSSWQEYCEKEFGKSRQRAYELLEISGTIDEIKSVRRSDIESGKNKEILDNLNSRQVVALKGLPPDKKAEVLVKSIAAQGGKSPKAETINGVRKNIDKEPVIQLDKTGYPIPDNLISEWDRATDQAMGWIRGFDTIHRQIIGIHGTDFAVAKINKSTLESDHSNYRSQLKQAVPYAVCPICQGKIPDKCKGCNPCNEDGKGKGLGWVNQRYWETCVPIELKKIRERAYGTKSPARLST